MPAPLGTAPPSHTDARRLQKLVSRADHGFTKSPSAHRRKRTCRSATHAWARWCGRLPRRSVSRSSAPTSTAAIRSGQRWTLRTAAHRILPAKIAAFADIDFHPAAPFPESGFRQRLSVYDGALSMDGSGVRARLAAWPAQDVIAISVEGAPSIARLRMLRYEPRNASNWEKATAVHTQIVQTRSHTAASQLIAQGGRIALTQEFREGDFCCKTAVAVAIEGRAGAAEILNETDVGIGAGGGPPYTILIASAATFDAAEDVAAVAFRQLDAAQTKGFAALERETAEWWHAFWRRGFVQLSSADGAARPCRTELLLLYLMGVASRGKYPPKFNGMIFNTGGDFRSWGSQHWFANLSCYYEALFATNRFELMDPMFDMYFGMLPACSVAARQRWGNQRVCIFPRPLLRWPRKTAGRYRTGRDGRALPNAEAVGAARRASWSSHKPSCAQQPGTGSKAEAGWTGATSSKSAASDLTAPSRTSWAATRKSPIGSGAATNSRSIASGWRSARTLCCAARWSSIATSPTRRKARTENITSTA